MLEIPESVLNRAAGGDRAAFEEIYRLTASFVFSVAMRVARNKEDAEEVTQDVYIKAHRNLAGFRGESALKTWLYRITVNTALDRCRKRRETKYPHVDIDDAASAVSVEPEAGKLLDRRADEQTIQALLSGLNDDQRVCIVLREIEGLSYEEISRALNININTVRTRLKRGREKLMAIARPQVEAKKHAL